VSVDAFTQLLHTPGFNESGNTLGGRDKKRGAGEADNGTPGKKTKTLMNFGFKKKSSTKPGDDSAAPLTPESRSRV